MPSSRDWIRAWICLVFAGLLQVQFSFAFLTPRSLPLSSSSCPGNNINDYKQSNRFVASMSSTSTGTKSSKAPRAPLPPIILSNVPGTWAYDTMSRRIRDDILVRIYEENDLDGNPLLSGVRAQLDQLKKELQTPEKSHLPPIQDDGGPDIEVWRELMQPYENSNWLDAPWLYTEFYFYRRIVQIFGYFKTQYDPFHVQKRLGLEGAVSLTKELAARAEQIKDTDALTALRFALFAALWGNKMDLSLWPSQNDAANKAQTFSNVLEASSVNLLADEFSAVSQHLLAHKGGRVDIIVDNAGFELITDLLLADCLIVQGLATKVVLHTKGHPTFVSDAMDKDVKETIAHLAEQGLPAAKERWSQYLENGAWELRAHTYWAQPFPFWQMPSDVTEDLSKATLAFIKGDANYRRLLGDRTWDLSTPFTDVASYFPCPVTPLRTLKAELGCGMTPEQVARASAADPKDWMVTGKYGVVQFFDPATM